MTTYSSREPGWDELRAVAAAVSRDVGLAGLLSDNLVAVPDRVYDAKIAHQLVTTCGQLVDLTRHLNDLLEAVRHGEHAPEAIPEPEPVLFPPDNGGHSFAERSSSRVLCAGDLRLDPDTGAVFQGTQPISLSPTQFSALAILLRSPGRVVGLATLTGELWDEPMSPRRRKSLHDIIAGLRQRLEPDLPAHFSRIQSIRDTGYRYLSEPNGARRLPHRHDE